MNLIGKIFIVLIFVLSLVFMTLAVFVYATHRNYRNEILGENESKLSDKCTPREVYYSLWHTITRKQVWQGQLVNRRKQGERWCSCGEQT